MSFSSSLTFDITSLKASHRWLSSVNDLGITRSSAPSSLIRFFACLTKSGINCKKKQQDGRKCRSISNLVHDCCSSLAHLCLYPCRSVLLYVHSAVRFEPYPIQEARVGNKTLLLDPSLLPSSRAGVPHDMQDSRCLMHVGSGNILPMRKLFMIVESKHNVPMQ